MVLVRYFAGARAAAGMPEEKVAATTLGELIDAVAAAHGDRLTRVLTACSFLIDGLSARDRTTALPDGTTVDVLPPFAGG